VSNTLIVVSLLVGAAIYATTAYLLWKRFNLSESPLATRPKLIKLLIITSIAFPLGILAVVLTLVAVVMFCLSLVLYVALLIGAYDGEPWYVAIPVTLLLTGVFFAVFSAFWPRSRWQRR
jgi:sterol desaturase/sphingolipid hydroxylase (fatty acid hydroxylase superfamily)